MKQLLSARAFTLLSSLLLVLFVSSSLYSQIPERADKVSKIAIGNITMALKSKNEGLQKSALYFAGKYRVNDVAKCVTEVLENSDNTDLRILAAKSLYRIGNKKGMEAIETLSRTAKDNKLRRVCYALNELYAIESGPRFVNND